MCMIVNTDMDGVEITQAAMPILLAWIHPDADRRPYEELLACVAASFPSQVQICLLQKDVRSVFGEKYGMSGTPTFLLMQAGCVVKRLLGEVDPSTLMAFVAQNIGSGRLALEVL